MNRFERVVFNHANLKRPVHIVAGTIAGWHFSESTQSTHVYTIGGVFPVSESPDQIDQVMRELNNRPIGQGEK